MKKEITFSYPAEAMQGATEIFLLGDFNNWNIEEAIKFEYAMDGFYRAVAYLEEGQTYNYRFLLDNGRWVNDHNAQGYIVIPELYIDNCVITIPLSAMEDNKVSASEETVNQNDTKASKKGNAKPANTTASKLKKANKSDSSEKDIAKNDVNKNVDKTAMKASPEPASTKRASAKKASSKEAAASDTPSDKENASLTAKVARKSSAKKTK